MNNTAELVRLKEEQLRLSQSKREHENKLSAILALIRKEGRMTREKYQQCCDAQIRHKQGIKRVDEMISSIKIKIFELSRLENQNKQSMERRLVDLERENAELREDKERLDWLLTDDGGFWVNWMYEKDEWTPELKASRDAIDACRNRRIGNGRQP